MAHYKKGRHGYPKKKREHRTPDGVGGHSIRMEQRKRSRKSRRDRYGNFRLRSKGYNA